MKTIFVTTGATVTFKELIQLVLEEEFIEAIVKQGYEKLIVQYGSQSSGASLFLNSLERLRCKIISSSATGVLAETSLPAGVRIEGFPFTNDIKEVMSKADLIISHAGTGSILDSLRLQKPLIVVVNSTLMNNHQTEITDELMKNDYLLGCNTKMDELISNLIRADNFNFRKLPPPNGAIIDQTLLEV